MNTKLTFDKMADAVPYLADLLDSKTIRDFKDTVRKDDKHSSGEYMRALLPVFLTEKRDSFWGLMSVISGKSISEIADQEWSETKKCMESPLIGEILDFFIFSMRMARNV